MDVSAERVVVVLAAGASTRMVQCKALMPWGGSTLISHLIQCFLFGGFTRVIVVAGGQWERAVRNAVASISDVTVIANPNPARGMLSSLKLGLIEALQYKVESVAFTPVDVPLLGPETVAAFVSGCSASADVFVASHNGSSGHPTLVSARVARLIIAAPEDATARTVLEAQKCVLVPVDDPGIGANLNTPSDVDDWTR